MTPIESVKKMWIDYHSSLGLSAPEEVISDHFCENEKDANELADLVNKGIKRATAGSLWAYEKTNFQIPTPGDVFIVKDWNGNAICVVKTMKITIVPFNEITEAQAYTEGEGDRSLEYWRRVHIDFYTHQFATLGLTFSESMPIVFEEFEKVFPNS